MRSTFKWALAGLVLQKVERGDRGLTEIIVYDADDIVPYSPVTQPRLDAHAAIAMRVADALQ